MIKELEKLDSIYQNTIRLLPINDRIVYCEQLIDKAQLSLIRNKKLLGKTIELQLTEIMRSAQEEIIILRKTLYDCTSKQY